MRVWAETDASLFRRRSHRLAFHIQGGSERYLQSSASTGHTLSLVLLPWMGEELTTINMTLLTMLTLYGEAQTFILSNI